MVWTLALLLLIQVIAIQADSPQCHKDCDKATEYCVQKECGQKTGSDLAECKRECHNNYWECCQCISECDREEAKCKQKCNEKQNWEKTKCERECKQEISECKSECVYGD